MNFAHDITTNHTFHSVQPLMNFWAAYTPSNESGVGRMGNPKDTVYQLYRDGTELRGVWTATPQVGRDACASLGEQCDYPILLGNDPLYGGSGGIPTIITASPLNGPQILRHELGHSIIQIGEEYDGATTNGYFGINAAHGQPASSPPDPIPWAHWLTDPEAEPRIERNVMPLQQYAWALMNTTDPWATTFISSGTFSRHLVRFSLSGLPSQDDLRLEVDGVDLNWEPRENIGLDRWLYDIYVDEPLSPGVHEVSFTLLNETLEGTAQMCSVEILEFGDEDEFNATPGYIGLYPTYSETNVTSYRPTDEGCLMRQVTTTTYCSVCLEGLWLTLLGRLSLIDDIAETCNGSNTVLNATLIPVAQFRQGDPLPGESYTVLWSKDGEVLDDFTNRTVVTIDSGEASGNYTLNVKFSTPEIRLDQAGVTEAEAVHTVSSSCG